MPVRFTIFAQRIRPIYLLKFTVQRFGSEFAFDFLDEIETANCKLLSPNTAPRLTVPPASKYRITDPLALPVRGPTLLWLTVWASIESQHRRVKRNIRTRYRLKHPREIGQVIKAISNFVDSVIYDESRGEAHSTILLLPFDKFGFAAVDQGDLRKISFSR